VRPYAAVLAVMLGGCSASEIVQNYWGGAPVSDLSQPNHRGIVAENMKNMFPKGASLGDLEISGLRPVDHLKGAAWLTCLKVDARGTPHNYAIFIKDGKVIESRSGVLIDQCHKETYTPFELPPTSVKAGT
jgi:hypothetical protein